MTTSNSAPSNPVLPSGASIPQNVLKEESALLLAWAHRLRNVHMLLAREIETRARELQSLASEPHQAPAGWQEIDSAPKDGTVIDVWLGEADAEEMEFYCGRGAGKRSTGWAFRDGRFRPVMGLPLPVVTVRPTHWMPLPPAPSLPEGQ